MEPRRETITMKRVGLPWGERTDALIAALLALLLRLGGVLVAWDGVPPSADGKFYHVVAQRIAHGDGYTWLWPDGVVTYAAHYPVGYPALMSVPYALFGAIPGVVMVLNAVLGALLVWLTHRLCLDALKRGPFNPAARQAAGFMATVLAFSPTLIAYTPALMTEGAVATFLVLSGWLALSARSCRRGAKAALLLRILLAVTLGGAVLLRPQSVLFAPVLGFLSFDGKFLRGAFSAFLVTLGTISVSLPWTLRNCDKMERCVFVSANGGWNLLIGTFKEGNGAWISIEGERVPHECREVFEEAAKDKCFGEAGMRRIRENPGRWLLLLPAKLRATLDYTSAAADHLVESGALSPAHKKRLSYPEFVFQRIEFLLALGGAWSLTRTKNRPIEAVLRNLLLSCGVAGFLGLGAFWGWFSCLLLLLGAPKHLRVVGVGLGIYGVFATIVVHGVFFGAGRYSLPLIPLAAPLAAVGFAALLRSCGYASRSKMPPAKFDTRTPEE